MYGKDDEGLIDFHNDYFPYPLYHDETLGFYGAMGGKSISDQKLSTYNPIKLYRGVRDTMKRIKNKGIAQNYKGEGMKTGGLIIFNKKGQPTYMYPEETGSEIVIDELMTAIRSIRGGDDSSTTSSSAGESVSEL